MLEDFSSNGLNFEESFAPVARLGSISSDFRAARAHKTSDPPVLKGYTSQSGQEWKWWIAKRCPSGYTWTQKPLRTKKIWMPKIRKDDESTSISPTIDIVSRITNIVQLILFIVDSGCTKHMTGNLKLLCNFVEKFLAVQASVVNVKWCLLKITLQAPFLNVQKTFDRSRSSLGLHQMTSDHNRSELGIQDHSNEQSSSKLVPKVVP
ncbi:hypothetical protein Tco_0775940 [Tanacetum coccineum]